MELITIDSRSISLAESPAPDSNPALVYLASLAESSRRPMGEGLAIIAEILTGQRDFTGLAWGALRFQHTTLIRSILVERYKPATANRILSALRGTLKAAWQLRQMSADDYQSAIDIKSIRGQSVAAGRALSKGELSALLDACGNDPAGVRDSAVISILYAGGLRRAELVKLDLADYELTGATLKVMGKGRKERLVHLPGGAVDALAEWLATRGDTPGPLFCSIRKGGHIWPGRLTTQAVYHILQNRAQQAGVKGISPHDLRRSFVGDLLDAGADISTVQQMAGHASVITTQRYDRRGEQAKRKAADLLHVPHKRRVLIRE